MFSYYKFRAKQSFAWHEVNLVKLASYYHCHLSFSFHLFYIFHKVSYGFLYQVVFLLSDGVLLLTGSLLFVTFHAMLHGIRAEEEKKEFI